CPGPAASGSGRPCVASCGASRVIIFPPPVLVTFPGPILSTCPQEAVLGAPGMA
ncbi:KRSC protein, partial [Irena cyanogastra]|nr:KRSC protein [Irena cyanogastra]